jgi:hypothetical protein
MESNPERLWRYLQHAGNLDRFESKHVDHHERLPVDESQCGQGPLQIDAILGGVFMRRHDRVIRQRGETFEEPSARRLEQHTARDPEQPRGDLGVTSEPDGSAAGTNEGFLREFLGIVPVAHKPKEVREHGLLMGPEDIFKLHFGLSR